MQCAIIEQYRMEVIILYSEVFPSRFKSLRLERDLSQEELAAETNISRTSISKMENGKAEPNLEQLGMIAEFFDVSVNWLLGLSNKKSEYEKTQISSDSKRYTAT